MRSERDFLGLPIHSLQVMLREISYCDHNIPCLIPDGIFGEETLEAVMRFQRQSGRPVTGRVDNGTWDAIVTAYYASLRITAPPRSVQAFRDLAFTARPGDCCVHMYLVQSMFLALSHVLAGIEPVPVTGRHTGASVRNAIWLQRRAGLDETGALDKLAWDMLSRLYGMYISRNFEDTLCFSEAQIDPERSPDTRGFPWEPDGPGGLCR